MPVEICNSPQHKTFHYVARHIVQSLIVRMTDPLSMEDIGMRDTYLHVRVLIDPYLEEEKW